MENYRKLPSITLHYATAPMKEEKRKKFLKGDLDLKVFICEN
jgi:hypothetical protein